MNFGKVSEQELEHIDFALPADPLVNKSVLAEGNGNTKFLVGCAKWGRKDWIGSLYPQGIKEKDFLKYYARVFNSIEFNGFYYNQHSKEQVLKWKEAVPEDFLFCPKFTQYITHVKRLKDAQPQVDEFLEVVSAFGKNLGPIFLMPHPQMTLDALETLETFIDYLPEDINVFLELRHEEWYKSNDGFNAELYDFLKEKRRGTVITDAAGRRDCAHMHLSTPECFIRFVGNSLHHTDYERIDEWVSRIKSWMDEGLEKCYFFMHQHEELHSPQLIKYLIEELNKKCGTNIKAPVMQTTLFG
ncbi:MAG: DUF72 domain-containing protein [Taibaiella sp.]|jgi:uncharacterized protein YecE (DUF72 family)